MNLSMERRKDAGTWAALTALVAVVSIGQAIQISNGALHPAAIKHIGVALCALVLGVAFSQARGPLWLERWGIVALGGLSAVFQLQQLGSGPPAMYLRAVPFGEYAAVLIVYAALSAALFAKGPWLGRLHGLAWLASFWALGAWLIKASPSPMIDVFTWTNHALTALAGGSDPYAIWMPNPYHHTLWYAPNTADAEWVHLGFPYPPLSLMISWVGWFFGGDMRWANLGLLALAGATMRWSRGPFGPVAAVVLLTTPRILFILEQAWTDAYVVGLIGLVAWCARRAPRWTAVTFGLLLATKQYAVFLVPLGFLLIPPPWDRKRVLRFILEAVAAGTLVTLPWILWNPSGFMGSLFVSGHPFRAESLSFLAYTAVDGKPIYPLSIQLVFVALAYVLIFFRSARGPAGFALSSALVINVFFSFSKHAFCNHHFLALASAAVALAFVATDFSSRSPQPSHPAAT